ncbi:hypothetical protein [Sphingomonas nostoxanthinifaciens]|uniref:hypothetical protein n=1 Tax=Sphingomonas nostoxanthinifaciens TaxID=2872652 RepID=UPI001CC1F2AC|nr:hypothetical protein [Sphingomonas nostoxanthinifaciens]UAK23566.1 hypothetical protein K8P63_14385 [Sphingomonas nostoxanthinifaciens]
MIFLLIAGLLALAAAPVSAAGNSAAPAGGATRIEYAQVIFHSRVVIRVRTAPPPTPAPDAWREKKGPHCVPMADIAGAAVLVPNSVDLVLRGGQRVRARFAASCPTLDYYSGFYIAPPPDALICSDRDVVRDRAGGECAIDRFRALTLRK